MSLIISCYCISIPCSDVLPKIVIVHKLWIMVMGTNPSRFQNNPQNPVEKISWNDAQAFCRKLSQITGWTLGYHFGFLF